MKPSLELFRLIKSLSKSEKRFFKLSSSLQSGEKNYLKIFDAIDAQEEYDEGKIKEQFKDELFIHHFPSEKNHLYKLILKSLRSFYSDNSIRSLLIQDLKNIEILYNKALYKECEKLLARAKNIAFIHEEFYYINELIDWQKKIWEQSYDEGDFARNVEKLIKEEEENLLKLNNLSEYNIIYSKLNLIFRNGGFVRNNKELEIIEEIVNHPLIKGKNTAISTKATSICYYIQGLCAATNRKLDDSYVAFRKVRSVLDGKPLIKEDSNVMYVNTMLHLLRCYTDSKEFDKAEELIRELQYFKFSKGQNTDDLKMKTYINLIICKANLLHSQGKTKESVELYEENEQAFKDNVPKITKDQEVSYLYSKSYSYFGVGDYRKSLNVLNEILNDSKQNIRKDLYCFARILNLMIHYELENYDYLEYLIKSTQRYLSKYERDYQIEDTVILFIRKLAKVQKQEDKDKVLLEMEKEIRQLLNVHQERIILEYFNIEAWIDSKIKRISFSEAIDSSI